MSTEESMTTDELDDRVKKILDALPASLVHDWLECLEDRGFEISDEGADENTTQFTFAFWDAADIVTRELELRAYRERKVHAETKP